MPYGAAMRWQLLFDDLEAQLARQDAAELESEVAERTRAERATVDLADRLLAHGSAPLRLGLGGARVTGVVLDVAPQWLVLNDGRADVLVPTAAVTSVAGLGRAAAPPPGQVLRRLGLGNALRALSRDRAPVVVGTVDGNFTGTIDRVLADHLDLAEHPVDEVRRSGAVRSVVSLPFAALRTVASRP